MTASAPAPAPAPALPAATALRPAHLRLPLTVALSALGLVAVVAGAALPWVVLFAGLRPMPGFLLEGGPLAAVAVAGLALPAVAAHLGGARILRPLAVLAGGFVAVESVLAATRIAAYVADPGPAGPLSQPSAGPGAWVMAVGGAFVVAAAVAAPVRHRPLRRGATVRLALAAMLYVAAVIHLLLTPAHLAEATVLGLGFLAAALVQLALAALVVVRPVDLVLVATLAVTVALVVLYGTAVLVGLPFGGGEEHEVGVVVGAGEPVDWWGFIDLVAELGAIGVAGLLFARTVPAPRAVAEEGTPSRGIGEQPSPARA